jgi:hypothetical protein
MNNSSVSDIYKYLQYITLEVKKMKTFLQLLSEDTKPHETEDGSVMYSHSVGPHTIHTHFYPRSQGGKVTGYDVHFYRHTPGSKGNPSSRQGMSNMTSAHRIAALRSFAKSIHHFIKTKKPAEIHGEPNTQKKSDSFHSMFSSIAKKTGGTAERKGQGTVIKFS